MTGITIWQLPSGETAEKVLQHVNLKYSAYGEQVPRKAGLREMTKGKSGDKRDCNIG